MTTDSTPTPTDAELWDERYRESTRIWSGNPNTALVREVEGLTPGRALDLGCGEGADAVWLARWGWRVTATDISRVALERAAEHAAEAGVRELVDWQFHDLGVSFPEGSTTWSPPRSCTRWATCRVRRSCGGPPRPSRPAACS